MSAGGGLAVKRLAMVTGLREDQAAAYRALHADTHPGVRDLLSAANMRKFSIFLERLPDGEFYLFGYYEYHGDDYEGDIARLDSAERNWEWLVMTDPMQMPLPGQQGWKIMEQVYLNE